MISIPKVDLLARRKALVKSSVELERERLRTELLRRIIDREMRRRAERV